jgi:hypothetical protein
MATLTALQENAAKRAQCTSQLERVCGRARKASKGNCLVCCGSHQSQLQQAGCAQAQLDSFCG